MKDKLTKVMNKTKSESVKLMSGSVYAQLDQLKGYANDDMLSKLRIHVSRMVEHNELSEISQVMNIVSDLKLNADCLSYDNARNLYVNHMIEVLDKAYIDYDMPLHQTYKLILVETDLELREFVKSMKKLNPDFKMNPYLNSLWDKHEWFFSDLIHIESPEIEELLVVKDGSYSDLYNDKGIQELQSKDDFIPNSESFPEL